MGITPISVVDMRHYLSGTKMTEHVVNLISSAKAESTYKQYEVYLKQFSKFCSESEVDPNDPTMEDCVNFLDSLMVKGLAYSTVNTARSALSYYFDFFKGVKVGDTPIVRNLLDAYGRANPPKPKYVKMWDVNVVLTSFQKMKGNSSLTLQELSFKTVTLISITSAQRGQSIYDFNVSKIRWESDEAIVSLTKPVKHSVKGAPLEIIRVKKFEEDRKICPYRALREYLHKTKDLRGSEDRVWISLTKPHRAITSDSLHRWVKSCLISCGIKGYGAHTPRHASTSKAEELGVDIDTIVAQAKWTNCITFARFYKRKVVHQDKFANAILRDVVKK